MGTSPTLMWKAEVLTCFCDIWQGPVVAETMKWFSHRVTKLTSGFAEQDYNS
jgi:hypothetical protein